MTWHIDGAGGGGGRTAVEFWKNTNIGLRGSWIDEHSSEPKEEGIGDIEEEKNDTGYYIFTKEIANSELDIEKDIGQRIDKGGGYDRRPEILMTAFLEDKVRNIVSDGIVNKVFKGDLKPGKDYRSVLFTVAFGGGTGTGIINPVAEILRKETGLSIYTLGTLTEPEEYDDRHRPLHRRCFNTTWALCELLTRSPREGVDAVFLLDNKILKGGRKEKNRQIFDSLFPMINQRKIDEGFSGVELNGKLTRGMNMPPIIVPCYYFTKKEGEDVNTLLEKVIENGLMECDYKKADTVVVFTSLTSLKEKERIEKWIEENVEISEEKIHVCRVWNSKREILMLLRNPYGGEEEDPFFDRLSGMIDKAIEFAKGNENIVNLISNEELKKYKDRKDFTNFMENEIKSEFKQNKNVNNEILEGFDRKTAVKITDRINDDLIPRFIKMKWGIMKGEKPLKGIAKGLEERFFEFTTKMERGKEGESLEKRLSDLEGEVLKLEETIKKSGSYEKK